MYNISSSFNSELVLLPWCQHLIFLMSLRESWHFSYWRALLSYFDFWTISMISGQSVAPVMSLSTFKRSPSRRTKSRWEPLPEDKPIEKPTSTCQDSARHGVWTHFSGRENKVSYLPGVFYSFSCRSFLQLYRGIINAPLMCVWACAYHDGILSVTTRRGKSRLFFIYIVKSS